MKGERLLKALATLEEAAYKAIDFPIAIGALMSFSMRLSSGKEAISGFRETMEGRARERKQDRDSKNFISYLKHEGFIIGRSKFGDDLLALTRKGRSKLSHLRKLIGLKPLPTKKYKRIKNNALMIVVFDIPESRRKERDWLRDVLRNLGFTMLQKSVWLGKIKIPEQLIDDLRRLYLQNAVEIFKITKQGNLSKLK